MKKITLLFSVFFAFVWNAQAQFPSPYCGPITFTNNVEPITLVNFAGINNTTDATVGAVNPAHEDFTAISGSVTAGQSYTITLKGNTDGNYTTKLNVFIDWNQDGDFDDNSERYDIGNIVNSTGVDAVQLTGSIAVPGTALGGDTRMRVVKKWNVYSDACNTGGTGYGQAEDYTLSVTSVTACLTGVLHPSESVSISTCDGITPNLIASDSNAGDYFKVNVTSGQTYKFMSSVATDYFTISTDSGASATASGTSPLTWVADVDGEIYVYIHLDSACGTEVVDRTTTVICGLPCLNGTLYPADPAVASACDGVTVNEIAPDSYAGEYSNVQVYATNSYIFSSSIVTDLVTVASADGTTAYASGTGSVAYTPTADGIIRVYLHLDSNCGTETEPRTKSFTCTTTGTVPDCVENPTPADGAIVPAFETFDLAWEASTTGSPAVSYNIYIGDAPDNLTLATNVTDTFITGVGPVGAFDTTIYWQVVALNGAGEAVGCTVWSFTSESAPAPPANDECAGAISLNLDEATCDGVNTNGTTLGATDSGVEPATCFNYGLNDVWYSFTVPENVATVDVSTDFLGGSLYDTEVAVYSGACDGLAEIGCDNDGGEVIQPNGSSWNSLITDLAVNVGETYYVRVSGYSETASGTFCLRIGTNQLLKNNQFDLANLSVYPNPAKNTLNVSFTSEINKVELFNVLGQKVIAKDLNATSTQLDISSLTSGAYFVKVTAGDNSKTIKVIKE